MIFIYLFILGFFFLFKKEKIKKISFVETIN